jgi:hypothetical protein
VPGREQSQPREGEQEKSVELKLEVPPSAIDEVARLPWLREASKGPATREELVTVKSERRKHNFSLRVRHAGGTASIKALTKGARAIGKLQRKLKPVFETVIERTAFPIHSRNADP